MSQSPPFRFTRSPGAASSGSGSRSSCSAPPRAGLAWWATRAAAADQIGPGPQYRVLKAGDGPTATINDVLVLSIMTAASPTAPVRQQPDPRRADGDAADRVIPGFAEGLQLTQAGGRYPFDPANLGYGPGRVPPGAPFGDNDTLSSTSRCSDHPGRGG